MRRRTVQSQTAPPNVNPSYFLSIRIRYGVPRWTASRGRRNTRDFPVVQGPSVLVKEGNSATERTAQNRRPSPQ